MTLNEFFAAHPKCALGFSGGVDSAYLLYAGVQAGRTSGRLLRQDRFPAPV